MNFNGQPVNYESDNQFVESIAITCSPDEAAVLADKLRECLAIGHTLEGLCRVLVEAYQCCDLTKAEIISLMYVIEENALNLHKKLSDLKPNFN